MAFTGSKYDKNLTTTEIAKRFRADVKEAVSRGELPAMKVSVRTRHFAGGSSIDVTVQRIDGVERVANPEALRLAVVDPHGFHRVPRLAPAVEDVRSKLARMLNAYNFDDSDIASDYFCVRFYAHVDVAMNWGAEVERARVELNAELCADARSDTKPDPGPANVVSLAAWRLDRAR